MLTTKPRLGGIILCGGQSTRMGTPKAWLPFGNETMLQRVVQVVETVAEPVIVVAAVDQELPELPSHVTILRDEMPEQGPLQGLLLGLKNLERQANLAFLTSCDVPFLQPAFIERMRELAIDHGMTVPHIGGRLHPLASVIAVSLQLVVRQLFDSGERRVRALFEQVPTRLITEAELSDIGLTSLRNINTPEEYRQALADVLDGES